MYRLGDECTEVLQQEMNEIKEPEEIYYRIDFIDKPKKRLIPLKHIISWVISVTKSLKN